MTTEQPKEQFRAWSIPVEVVRIFQDGGINAIETLLLATIDSLVSESKGCWASNEFLSRKMNTSENSISRMLTKLKRLGLVWETGFDGRSRHLETAWSRMQPAQKCRCSLPKNAEAAYPKMPSPNRVGKRVDKRRGRRTTSPTPRENLDLEDWDIKAGGYLKEVLVLYDSDLVQSPGDISVGTLAKSIFKLRTRRSVSKDEIKSMIRWLKDHYGDTYVPKMHKRDDIFTNWARYKDAVKNWEHEQAKVDDGGEICQPISEEQVGLINRVRSELAREGWNPNDQAYQEDVDEVLETMGLTAGAVNADCI